MKISRNTVATVNFVVTDQDGKVVGRTDPKHPIEALIGHGSLVIGLDKPLVNLEILLSFGGMNLLTHVLHHKHGMR